MEKRVKMNKNGWDQILKHINEERPLTTFEVSKICGVVHSTVTNWIDEGRLNAYRTPGKHRRIKKEDFMVFLKLYAIPIPKMLREKFHNQRVTPDFALPAESGMGDESGKTGDDLKSSAGSNGKKRILIVEDDMTVSETITEILKKSYPDIDIAQAFDGFEAGKEIATSPPDLLILDLILPGVDGFKILKNIRQDRNCSDVRIVAITGYDTPENREKLLKFGGADSFVSKPLDIHELRNQVESLLFETALKK